MRHSTNTGGAGAPGGTVVRRSSDGLEVARAELGGSRGALCLGSLVMLSAACAAGATQNVSSEPKHNVEFRHPEVSITEEQPPPLVQSLKLRRITGDEIKRLIVGKEIFSESVPSGIITSSTEKFTQDLIYIRRSGFGVSRGQYQIINDTICISFSELKGECRRFYKDRLGTIYQEYLGTASGELEKLGFR
jgi:hypothetical protein